MLGMLSAPIILAATCVASWFLMRPAARAGFRLGLVDLPSTRRTRARPIPTTGGMVIFATTVASLLIALRFCGFIAPDVAVELSNLAVGGAVIVVLGMLDDRVNLRPHVKLPVQIAVAIMMVAGGVGIEKIRFVHGTVHELGWFTYPVTVLWFVGFMNAMNLIDGLDGLASGIASIGAAALFAVGIINDNVLLSLMAAGILGSTVGFLLHNFREGNVYLGDAGSMTLGFFLAGGAIVGARGDGASNAILVASACMVVPALDVVTTIVRRRRARSGIMTPDRCHTHHRLIRFGFNPKMAVIILWGVTFFFGGQTLGFVSPKGLLYLVASGVAAFIVGNLLLDQHRKNVRTIGGGLRAAVLYIVGVPGSPSPADTHDGMTLRELIVAQIRREALYRRLVRGEAVRARAHIVEGGARETTPGRAGDESAAAADDLVMDGEEKPRNR